MNSFFSTDESKQSMSHHPLAHAPFPALVSSGRKAAPPSDEQCFRWWEAFDMLDNIKRHSRLVADIATALAGMAAHDDQVRGALSRAEFIQTVRVSGLLHDLGKTYSIRHGGNHSQLGASWVMELTRNPAIAQGVMHHVYWPGTLDPCIHFLPLAIIYSDKRAMHDRLVGLDERFADLRVRYGHSEKSIAMIARSHAQGKELEQTLSAFLNEDLHAYFTDRRRLVG